MQTPEQVMRKIEEMFKRYFPGKIYEDCRRLLKSGAIDLESEADDYFLPKCLLIVALENAANDFNSNSKSQSKMIKNLRRF